MLKLLVVVLFIITFILMGIFIDGLMELHKKEKENLKNLIREGIEGYLDQTFGYRAAKIFKTILDSEGNMIYLVYLSQFEWFKSAKYQWYEVYVNNDGFHHVKVQG
ncbi:hypothetical protein [Bacillus massilinigeriensis]|uniref:hypothetical protein n=1 Tax=Bacillus massilionigeriensis TaxID=1805475 RepID=UPI00096AFBA1|nr:hypothetical protein [Bacillus massilionigeriensis]